MAGEHLRWLGFRDLHSSGKTGADGHVDLESAELVVVVQYDANATAADVRPVRELSGVAASRAKKGVFFAMSYTAAARTEARTSGIALFRFGERGPEPDDPLAEKLSKRRRRTGVLTMEGPFPMPPNPPWDFPDVPMRTTGEASQE